MRRRLAAFALAACVVLSGCGVRMGMDKVDDAKQARKQVEGVQHKLQKDLNKEQEN